MSNENRLKPIDRFLKKYDWPGEVCDKNSDIWKKVAEVLAKAGGAYSVGDIRKVTLKDYVGEESTHYTILLHGGNNGNQNWVSYFNNLREVFVVLYKEFDEAWLWELDNDAVDDVHYVYLGVR